MLTIIQSSFGSLSFGEGWGEEKIQNINVKNSYSWFGRRSKYNVGRFGKFKIGVGQNM